MSNYIEKITIVGWRPNGLIHHRSIAKNRITAITRIDSTSKLPAGVDIKKVNYDDPASLVLERMHDELRDNE
ncbi:hypothetical protein C8J56DRAFT_1037974 [Mycena floridula]|nr:hypothetical protein C8J56DRAFT_1037974 [Mycena floridula]